MNVELTLRGAFGAGALSSVYPCILPLLPGYLFYLAAVSGEKFSGGSRATSADLFPYSFSLIGGFTLALILLGTRMTAVGEFLSSRKLLLQRAGGVLLTLLGTVHAGGFEFLKQISKQLPAKMLRLTRTKSVAGLVGVSLAVVWTACFSPLFGSILMQFSLQPFSPHSILLLGAYVLGLAVPLLLATFCVAWFFESLNGRRVWLRSIQQFAGLGLIFTGILFLTDKFYLLQSMFSY